MKTMRRIGGWLAPYRGRMILAMVLTALACLFNLPVPLLVQAMVDRVVTQGHWDALPLYAALLFGVFAVQAVLAWVNSLVDRPDRPGGRPRPAAPALRAAPAARPGVLRPDPQRRDHRAGDGRRRRDPGVRDRPDLHDPDRPGHDAGDRRAACSRGTGGWRPWSWLVAPLFALNFRYFMGRIRATNTIIREKMDLIFGNLKAKLDGTIVIKVCAREPEEIAEFAAQLDDAHVPRVLESRLGAAFSNLSVLIGGVGTALVFAAGALEVLRGPDDARRGGRDGGPGRDGLRAGGAAGRPGVCLRADGRERRPAGRDPRPRAGRRRAGARARSGRCPARRAVRAGPSSSTGSASAIAAGSRSSGTSG